MKIGAPLIEFDEGTQADTGTVVGEIGRGETAAGGRTRRQQLRRALQVFRPCGRSRASSMSISGSCKPAVPTAPSPRGRRARRQEPCGSGSRRAAARHAPRHGATDGAAHAEIVPATVNDEADIEDWRNRRRHTVRLVRAIAAACRAEPSLNAWYNGSGRAAPYHRIDIGIAVDTEGGLFVPVLRDVGERDAADLRAGLTDAG